MRRRSRSGAVTGKIHELIDSMRKAIVGGKKNGKFAPGEWKD